MSDVFLLSRISGLSFTFPFLPPLLFFYLVLLLFLFCSFSANSPAFFPENSPVFFVRRSASYTALVEQLGDGG